MPTEQRNRAVVARIGASRLLPVPRLDSADVAVAAGCPPNAGCPHAH